MLDPLGVWIFFYILFIVYPLCFLFSVLIPFTHDPISSHVAEPLFLEAWGHIQCG